MTSASVTDELLRLVSEHERRRCAEITAAAEAQAAAVVREAHRNARARMRENVSTLKQERQRSLALADAELDTVRRQHQQRCDYALLESAWEPLRAALAARWRDSAARRRWVAAFVRHALARLPHVAWRIEHPADWPGAERAALAASLGSALGMAPQFAVAGDIAAGLRVQAGAALLDGTLEGLLADRRAVEALLLAEIGQGR